MLVDDFWGDGRGGGVKGELVRDNFLYCILRVVTFDLKFKVLKKTYSIVQCHP